MSSKDLRAQAREALRGKWGVAVSVGFVATLLMGGVSAAPGAASGSSGGYLSFSDYRLWSVLMTVAVVSMLLAIVIGGAVNLGLCGFHVKLVKGEPVRFADLFGYFHQLWRGFCMSFLMGLFVFLWTLLLIVPGIIAAYSYAMVPYLMAEFPELTVMDALRESKRLMKGNRFRLFCLSLSFIGWEILASLTMGIGFLWLIPYEQTAIAAFYMDVTGRGRREDTGDSWNQNQYINRGPEF